MVLFFLWNSYILPVKVRGSGVIRSLWPHLFHHLNCIGELGLGLSCLCLIWFFNQGSDLPKFGMEGGYQLWPVTCDLWLQLKRARWKDSTLQNHKKPEEARGEVGPEGQRGPPPSCYQSGALRTPHSLHEYWMPRWHLHVLDRGHHNSQHQKCSSCGRRLTLGWILGCTWTQLVISSHFSLGGWVSWP